MFDKIKQFKQLKDLQAALEEERVEIEKQGIKVVINGKLDVIEINLNSELNREEQEKILIECFNDAHKKVQMNMASKFSQMPNFGL